MFADCEEQRKQAVEMYAAVLASAPDSLIKSLTGKEYANHAVEGAKVIEEYVFQRSTDK